MKSYVTTTCVYMMLFISSFFFWEEVQAQLRTHPEAQTPTTEITDFRASPTILGGSTLKFFQDLGFRTSFQTKGTTVFSTFAYLILILFGLLGMIFFALAIYAGLSWIFSGGVEEKVTKAKKVLRDSLIGLLIILASYFVTYFIISLSAAVTVARASEEGKTLWDFLTDAWGWVSTNIF